MGEIQNSPKQWKTELMAGNQLLGEKRGVFQGDNLSPLLFILALILLTLSLVLRKVKAGYSLGNGLPTNYNSSSFHGWSKALWKKWKPGWYTCTITVCLLVSEDIRTELGQMCRPGPREEEELKGYCHSGWKMAWFEQWMMVVWMHRGAWGRWNQPHQDEKKNWEGILSLCTENI